MKKTIKRIGILTGGGDCPGINAVLRAVTKTAMHHYGLDVVGIEDGFQGLVEDRVRELTMRDVSGILTRGGTILGSNNRLDPRKIYEGQDENDKPIYSNKVQDCLANIEKHNLDAIILIGGDGTMSVAAPFIESGINFIAVPKTIDNDIVGTDITFGFTTAYTTATLSLDRLHSTADSHHRVMVCEVMGRNAGWLALHAGVASGSDVILIPEIPFDIDRVADYVKSRMTKPLGFSIVVTAEGARPFGGEPVVAKLDPTRPEPITLGGIGAQIAHQIAERSETETRTTVLGHVIRGGPPVAADRVLASQFGHRSMELLMCGKKNRMVVMSCGELRDIDILDTVDKQRLVPTDHPLISVARSVKTCFGD